MVEIKQEEAVKDGTGSPNEKGVSSGVGGVLGFILLVPLFLFLIVNLIMSFIPSQNFDGSFDANSNEVILSFNGDNLLDSVSIKNVVYSSSNVVIKVSSLDSAIPSKFMNKEDKKLMHYNFSDFRGSKNLYIYYKGGYDDFIKDFSKRADVKSQ